MKLLLGAFILIAICLLGFAGSIALGRKARSDPPRIETSARPAPVAEPAKGDVMQENIRRGKIAAVQQGDALLKLIGLGGDDLVKAANMLAITEGIALADVQLGIARAQQIKDPASRSTVISAAAVLAVIGECRFDTAVRIAVDEGLGRGTRDKVAAAIVEVKTDHFTDAKTIQEREARVRASADAQRELQRIRDAAKYDVESQEFIKLASEQARGVR